MSLRTLRGGFEGFGLQAEPRPDGCGRIQLSAKNKASNSPVEFEGARSSAPCGMQFSCANLGTVAVRRRRDGNQSEFTQFLGSFFYVSAVFTT